MNLLARHSPGRDYVFGAALAVITLAVTTAPAVGDTFSYVNSIRDFQMGRWTAQFNPIGEFGHLLWRPLGALLAPIFTAFVPDTFAWSVNLKIGYGLILLNEMAGILAAALFFRISRRMSGSVAVAILMTVGLIWANGFLLYTKAGTSYVFGTAVEVCAIWVLTEGNAIPGNWGLLTGGALLGIAALCWTPFALIVPAAAAIPWAVNKHSRRVDFKNWVICAATSGAVYLVVLIPGAWLSGVRSAFEMHTWFLQSNHGLAQTRRALRAVSGLARLLFDLSNDGILLKRFLLKDPYNPVTLYSLIRSSLWKIAVFYAFLLATSVAAIRTASGRRMLIVLAMAAVPMLVFAIFLFEPSSPERFLPMLPFVLLTLAAAWMQPPPGETPAGYGKWVPWMGGVLLAAVVPINASAFVNSPDRLAAAQLHDYARAAAPGDLLYSVQIREPVNFLIEQRPFDPLCRGLDVSTAQVFGTVGRSANWRMELARRILTQWTRNKNVWITKWAMRESPPAEMGWVEGDDPAMRWREIPAFFAHFDFDRSTELADGFERFARSEKNREMLEDAAKQESPAPAEQKE